MIHALAKNLQQHDVHFIDGLLLGMKQIAQFTIFGLHGINLFNDFGQVGIGHDVVHDAGHKLVVGNEHGLNLL